MMMTSALTVALDLPDGITHAPERWHGEEDWRQVAIRDPDQQKYCETKLKDRSHPYECLGGDTTRQDTHDDRENKVCDTECDHVITDVLHSQRACHVRLKTAKIQMYTPRWKRPHSRQ